MNRALARKIMLFLGDWGALYLSLFLLVFLRYGEAWEGQWQNHLRPFSLIFPIWLIALYSSYLYETRFFRPSLDAFRAASIAIFASLFGSISAFYLFPPGLIQPRLNMVLFTLTFTAVFTLWRILAYKALRQGVRTNVLFLGGESEVKELTKFFKDHPQLGYTTVASLPENTSNDEVSRLIKEKNVGLIVVRLSGASNKHNIFPLLASGVTAIDLEEFYERVLNKVSPEILDQAWFIRNLENINAEVYKIGKRVMDILIGLAGTLLTKLFYLPVAIAIKATSRGPVIFAQQRVGQGGRVFRIYKFRTMYALAPDGSAETKGAKWAKVNDARVTPVGKFLRATRIDELPQFWNILRGDMSFVGPRPERPEFVEKLQREILHYNMRHLVKPGLTGWAQINYKYGDSVKDALVKLQYDIYYAKKRSIVLDLAIILKTLKIVLMRAGQ